MSKPDIRNTDPGLLAKMLQIGGSQNTFPEDDLAAILEHQLSASIQFDLATLDPAAALRVQTITSSRGLTLNSFTDLFEHPNPPVELLRITKDFAKSMINHPESPLPNGVSRVMYFASIVTAWLRCDEWITNLDKPGLRDACQWAMEQDWVDDATRSFFREAVARLQKDER